MAVALRVRALLTLSGVNSWVVLKTTALTVDCLELESTAKLLKVWPEGPKLLPPF